MQLRCASRERGYMILPQWNVSHVVVGRPVDPVVRVNQVDHFAPVDQVDQVEQVDPVDPVDQ